MSRKTILFITTRFPYPLTEGGKLRVFHLISELQKEYDLTLLTLGQPDSNEIQILERETGIKKIVIVHQNRLQSLFEVIVACVYGLPLQIGYYKSRITDRWIKDNINRFDLAIYHLIRASHYSRDLGKESTPAILEMCDAISENFAQTARHGAWWSPWRWISAIEAKRTLKFELEEIQRFSFVTMHASKDAERLNIPTEKLLISTQGTSALNLKYTPPSQRKGRNIALIGRVDFYPNVSAVRWIAEHVMPHLPKDICLKVIGDCSIRLRASLEKLPQVIVTGRVDSLEQASEDCFAAIAPMQVATGIQNKVLEYFALGLPSVVSPSVFSGLLKEAEGCCQIANEPAQWITALNALIEHPSKSDEMANKAHQYVSENHKWERIGQSYREYVAKILAIKD